MTVGDDSLAIGIDFGTTNTCAYLYRDGKLECLENREGARQTPSHVYFTSNKIFVGYYAKKMNSFNQGKGVYAAKRLLGRKFGDLTQRTLEKFQFAINKVGGKPIITIKTGTENLDKSPQDICAIILEKVKKDAEDKLGCGITKAVITVPAYFNTNQRKETLEAARQAGFLVLKLLNEPNASALNFYLESKTTDHGSYSLVYDLGGGTFDVSIMKKVQDNVEVIAVDGDTQLGGNDFDDILVDHVCAELEKRYACDIKENKRLMNELQILCETAKIELSFVEKTFIVLKDFVSGDRYVEVTLTRHTFEELIMTFLKRTIDITDRCVKSAKVDKARIDDIILAGGSSRIPKIKCLLSDYFGGRKLSNILNPDESVARGAALQAAMLSGHSRQKINEMKIVDIVPLSLGWKSWGDLMDTLIPKNTPIPATGKGVGVNVKAWIKSGTIQIFEGEQKNVTKNMFLGEIEVARTPAPPGQSKVLLTMSVDSNGVLTFIAKDKKINVDNKLQVVSYTRGIRSHEEIQKTIDIAEKNKDEDARFYRLHKRKTHLSEYCEAVIYNMDTRSLEDDYKDIYVWCKEVNKLSRSSDDENQIEHLIAEIKQKFEPLVEKFEFEYMPQPCKK